MVYRYVPCSSEGVIGGVFAEDSSSEVVDIVDAEEPCRFIFKDFGIFGSGSSGKQADFSSCSTGSLVVPT